MIERRKDPRAGVECQVYFLCLEEGGGIKAQDVANVVNISDSGVLIETTIPILTQQIKIIAPPKDREKLEVYAELVYSINLAKDRYRCGLSFQGDPFEVARFVGSLTSFPGNLDEE